MQPRRHPWPAPIRFGRSSGGGVDVVTLDVCVRDDRGQFVPGLVADDFLVLENGQLQRLAQFMPVGVVPISAALLIDVSGSMFGDRLAQALQAARSFAAGLGSEDRLEILLFNDRARRLRGFDDAPSEEPPELAGDAARGAAAIEGTGLTSLFDAVLVAITDLERARRQRRETREVVVVLSDGEDTASRVDFDELLPAVRQSGALVYSVSLRRNDRGVWLGATWPLLRPASETGARALSIPRVDTLVALFREIHVELRHLYQLSYVPADARRDGQWRTVAVRVPTRRVRATTRAGYYATRPWFH